MKTLKKLALVTAVAAVGSSAYALEKLDDKELAATTGQDGITITITPDKTAGKEGIRIDEVLIHDNNGLAATKTFKGSKQAGEVLGGTGKAGALVIKDLVIKAEDVTTGGTTTTGNITLDVDTDAGSTTADNKAFINVGVNMNGKHTIKIGDGIYVGKSGATRTAAQGGYTGATGEGRGTAGTAADRKKILGGLELSMSDAKMNVQMGEQPQGAMVLMDAQLTTGLEIKNLEIIDADGHNGAAADAGGLYVKSLKLTDKGQSYMTMTSSVDIDKDDGIVLTMNTPTDGLYGYIEGVGISSNPNRAAGTAVTYAGGGAIGDVELVGLKMGTSTIAIRGHD